MRVRSQSRRVGKYRRKPVVIEAVQWLGDELSWKAVNDFLGLPNRPHGLPDGKEIMIRTAGGGVMTASITDWVMKDVDGDFSVRSDSTFRATYEAVNA